MKEPRYGKPRTTGIANARGRPRGRLAIVSVVSINLKLAAATLSVATSIAATAGAAAPQASERAAARTFYTLSAEIALARHEPRLAALQYAAAARTVTPDSPAVRAEGLALVRRAADVAAKNLQPGLALGVAEHWISIEPDSLEARLAAVRAALDLDRIDQAALHERVILERSPMGVEGAFRALQAELSAADNVFGARRLADRLAARYPESAEAARTQGLSALRANDPAAAAIALGRALSLVRAAGTGTGGTGTGGTGGAGTGGTATGAEGKAGAGDKLAGEPDPAQRVRELTEAWWRARILSGEVEGPLAEARARASSDPSLQNRLEVALLLIAAQRDSAARTELTALAQDTAAGPVAVRLLGLLDYQAGDDDAATQRFSQLLATGRFNEDALYYLGAIAERRGDAERAIALYAQAQSGDNALAAALRAAQLLRQHGAASAADQILDRLLADDPTHAPDVIAARARGAADAQDLPGAVAILDAGIEQYPDVVNLRYSKAALVEDHGDADTAIRVLEDVLKRRPDDPAALNALGYTLADHGRELVRARRLIERAHSAAPNDAAFLDSLGWVLFREGKDDAALPYLKRAFDDDRGGDIAAHLGEVLWRQGRQDEAEHVWSRGFAVDPDNRLLKATRERLHVEQ